MLCWVVNKGTSKDKSLWNKGTSKNLCNKGRTTKKPLGEGYALKKSKHLREVSFVENPGGNFLKVFEALCTSHMQVWKKVALKLGMGRKGFKLTFCWD